MTEQAKAQEQEVLVIVDPDFGDRLRQVWPGRPVWITMSAANAPVVQALWNAAPGLPDHLSGITGFRHDDRESPEEQLLANLETLDLHHGPYSTDEPYSVLSVIGCQLSDPIRAALLPFGFSTFQLRPDGFSARRSADAAKET